MFFSRDNDIKHGLPELRTDNRVKEALRTLLLIETLTMWGEEKPHNSCIPGVHRSRSLE